MNYWILNGVKMALVLKGKNGVKADAGKGAPGHSLRILELGKNNPFGIAGREFGRKTEPAAFASKKPLTGVFC